MPDEAPESRPPAGPLAEVEPAIRSMILRAGSQPGKHCARSALRHIDKAWEIREVDPDMAAFRAITGEEEAATTIFHALRRHEYAGADKLKPNNHLHKAAVVPFLQAMGDFLTTAATNAGFSFNLRWKDNDQDATLQLLLRPLNPSVTKQALVIPPLHFDAKVNAIPYDFSVELKKVSDIYKRKDVHNHIRARAERR